MRKAEGLRRAAFPKPCLSQAEWVAILPLPVEREATNEPKAMQGRSAPPRAHRVAVVLVNYNSTRHTLECIETIQQHSTGGPSYQIIVVDNASREQERAALEPLRSRPGVTLVFSRLNTGFSGGNMLGVAQADADYYYFLNNDCLLESDALGVLTRYLDEHSDVGLASGLLRHEDGNPRRNFSYFPSLLRTVLGTGAARLLRPNLHPPKHGAIDEPLRVPVLAGCSMFVRAPVFESLGGFDTNHFLYCEEEDLARRFAGRGLAADLVPNAGFVHLGSMSTPSKAPYLREFHISLLYYIEKHHGRLWRRLYTLALFFKLLGRSPGLAWFVLRGASMRHSLRHDQELLPPLPAAPPPNS